MGVTAADFDGDGYPDIYVANDKTENFLFHNKHDGTFEEIAGDARRGLRTERRDARRPWARCSPMSMATARVDLWVTDSKYNRLMRNTGKRTVSRTSARVPAFRKRRRSTRVGAAALYDFDNDGWLDILIFHGGLIHWSRRSIRCFAAWATASSPTCRARPARCST